MTCKGRQRNVSYRRRRRRATEATEGSFGDGLVRSLVKQIGGVLNVDGSDGLSGTISFPDLLAGRCQGTIAYCLRDVAAVSALAISRSGPRRPGDLDGTWLIVC